jgi:outer membrane protein
LGLGMSPVDVHAQSSLAPNLLREEAVAIALERNFGVQMALVNEAGAALNNAWGAVGAFPRISGSLGAGSNVTDQTQNPSTFLPIATESQSLSPGLQAQWTLFDGMGMFATKKRLDLLTEQASGNVQLVMESTVQAVLNAYDNLLVQERSADVLAVAMDLTRQRLLRIRAAEELGTSGTFDRLQFENALINDSSTWLRQASAARAARRNLNVLMVQEENTAWTLESDLGTPQTMGDMEATMSQLMSDNSALQNAVLAGAIANTGVDQAQAQLWPVLGFAANWGQTLGASRAVSDFPNGLVFNPYANGDIQSNVTNYGASLTLNFNLFNGGATKRAIQQAQIQVDLAAMDQERLTLEVRSALLQAWDQRSTAFALWSLSKQRRQNAEISASLGADRYQNGSLNALDFRALDVALLQAKASELAAVQAWNAAHWQVLRLSGRLRGNGSIDLR